MVGVYDTDCADADNLVYLSLNLISFANLYNKIGLMFVAFLRRKPKRYTKHMTRGSIYVNLLLVEAFEA